MRTWPEMTAALVSGLPVSQPEFRSDPFRHILTQKMRTVAGTVANPCLLYIITLPGYVYWLGSSHIGQ